MSLLTEALEVPGCTALGCMDPLVPLVVQVVHVGLDLHAVQEGHVAPPLE